MLNIDWKDLAMRAVHTFWQAFSVVFVLPIDALDVSAWETTLAAAAMAGLSALKTALKALIVDSL